MARVYKLRPNKGSFSGLQVNWWRRKKDRTKRHRAQTQSSHQDEAKPAKSLQDLPYETLQNIVIKLPGLALSHLKLAMSKVLNLAREHQFEHLVFQLPSTDISDMIGDYPLRENGRALLKKGQDSLHKAVAVLQDPQVVGHVRSVHICRVGMIRTVPARYHVSAEVMENFARLLVHAQYITQIWLALPTDILPNRILARFLSLVTLRVNTATTPQLKGLHIERLTIDHYQLDDRDTPLRSPKTHPMLPWLPELTNLCIHAHEYSKAQAFCLLDGRKFPKLTHLSLKGTFGPFYLNGSWSQVRSLTVIGKFHNLRWIAPVAPYIQRLSMSVAGYDFKPIDDSDLVGMDFGSLEVLELHWCNLEKFPNGTGMPRLSHYSESRRINKVSGNLDLLKNINLHLEQLQLLAIRAQCGMQSPSEIETLNIDETYSKLREVRKQRGRLNCLIQASAAPITKDSWLHHAFTQELRFHLRTHDDDVQRRLSERLKLLRKADPQSKFAETRGEDFSQHAPHPFELSAPEGIYSKPSYEND